MNEPDPTKVLRWEMAEDDVDRLKSRLSQLYYDNLVKFSEPTEGLKEWLDALATSRIPCAIVSNLDRKNMVDALERMGLKNYSSPKPGFSSSIIRTSRTALGICFSFSPPFPMWLPQFRGVSITLSQVVLFWFEALAACNRGLLRDVPHTANQDSVCQILLVISSVPSCKLIEEKCVRTFSMNFDYCTTASIDFVMLDEATFGNILQHPDLTVTSEERVLNAILLWCCKSEELFGWEKVDEMMLNFTPELVFGERLYLLEEFLGLVRFPLLPFSILHKLERSNLMRNPKFSELVKEAITYLEYGSSGHEKDIEKFQHRRSSFKELQYICDGDSNGVLYFAGTSYGEHQWVNPVLSKKVTISASSPLSRFTDPKVLVSRSYQGTSFAGPRMEDGRNSTWWMVDLGPGHQLMCNYYTVRQDGSRAFMRNWSFEGSMDGKNWTTLRVHEDDETMCKASQFASWLVVGLLPFRFFRLLLNAPTTDAANPWILSICFFELYGYFR